MTSLASAVRNVLLSVPEVSRLTSVRRATSCSRKGQPADSIYFLEEGLVKLTRTNRSGGRIILAICGPGQMIGEEASGRDASCLQRRSGGVDASHCSCAYPRESMTAAMAEQSRSGQRASQLICCRRELALAQKVEMLCLHDVEYRILYYLAELSTLVKPPEDGEG